MAKMHSLSPLQAIYAFCKECNGIPKGGNLQPLVECTAGPDREDGMPMCNLWPYRLGKYPENRRKKLTPEQRAELKERAKLARAAREAKKEAGE